MVLIFNDNLENVYKFEKYEDKFGQFAKKIETAMKLVPKETTILVLALVANKGQNKGQRSVYSVHLAWC